MAILTGAGGFSGSLASIDVSGGPAGGTNATNAAKGGPGQVDIPFVVMNTNDSGPGSLRQAIFNANANPGLDTIAFAIPGAGMHTISPTSPLPNITDPVVIDGYTQPGSSPNTLANGDNAVLLIELNGSVRVGTDGLTIAAGSSTVRGLVINSFNSAGIIVLGGGDVIAGNFIGTDTTGTTALGNAGGGVIISAANNTVGGTTPGAGNVISGNTGDGLEVNGSGATGAVVQGNIIGLNAAGTAILGNTGEGLLINDASGALIGGTVAAARNVISGNGIDGVSLNNAGATGNLVQGNFIGTDTTGTIALGNVRHGVSITHDNNSTNPSGSDNTIGGTVAGAGNLISGNGGFGIVIFGPNGGASGNLVQGNFIGTDVSGTQAVGNVGDGIVLSSAPDNTVGGTTAAARNVISGNGKYGVVIESSPSTGNLVQGNFIGTDVSGTSPLGNANHGVIIQVGASANTIGGTAAGSGNVIAFNTGDGVTVVSGTGNAILSNAIFANGGLGIDLGADGVTPNDSLGHNGPNNYQNFPILTSVVTSGGTTTLSGTLNSTPNATFTVQFFANAAPDPSGFGEGQQYLGQTRVTTDGSGNASFSVTLSTPPLVGQFFTATATDDPAGNTSEFSQDISSGTTVTNTNDSGPGSLRQAILNADANDAVPETISFNIPTTDPGYANGVFTIQPHSDLPILLDNITIDGTTQTKFTGDTNPLGPEVVLNGSLDSGGTGAGLRLDDNNTVEGLVVNGFAGDGISLNWYTTSHTAMNNAVLDNYIGTDPTGTKAVPNNVGVNLTGYGSPSQQATGNIIQGNLISGNLSTALGGGDFTGTQIIGNLIGTTRDGVSPLGNGGDGITLGGAGAPNNLIKGNTIAYNKEDGILDAPDYSYSVAYTTSGHQGNAFLQNSIFSNGMLGIDLLAPGTDGNIDAPPGVPLQNTPGGPHQGANLLQNNPVLTSAVSGASSTVITGSLNSTPSETFHLEFFASPTANASGYGEGKTYLGATSVTTDASGNASFSVALPVGSLVGQVLSATATDPGNNTSAFSADIPVKATPTVTWANPADITYGTSLGTAQLDATASVPGAFTYTPATGTVLSAGQGQTLSATFTPFDSVDYNTVTATTTINVLKATPTITWANPADITYGTPLGTTQLDATASVPGEFAYTPATGTVLSAGPGQTLSATFTPTDLVDYNSVTATTTINVLKATPTITWANPADITYGTPLGTTQLDATSPVAGTFSYSPVAGTVLGAGTHQALTATFTPTDTADHNPTSATVFIDVAKTGTSTAVTSSVGTPVFGQPVTFTATVTVVVPAPARPPARSTSSMARPSSAPARSAAGWQPSASRRWRSARTASPPPTAATPTT